jgi:hypothetical protein
VIPKAEPVAVPVVKKDEPKKEAEPAEKPFKPTMGFGQVGPLFGLFQRDYSNTTTTATPVNTILFGAQGGGQVWFTQQFFLDVGGGFGLAGGHSVSKFEFAAGYRAFVADSVAGPTAWMRLGYRGINWNLNLDAVNLIHPMAFSSVFVGLGGEIPIRAGWVGQLTLDLGLFRSVTETGVASGTVNSSTDVSAFLGAYHKSLFGPRMGLRGGVAFWVDAASFSSGASASHRVLALDASLLYYF